MASFSRKHLPMDVPHSEITPDRCHDLAALARCAPPGSLVEVGVYRGGSAFHLYQAAIEQDRMLYLFDTFTGIPYRDEIDQFNVGDFANTDIEAVQASMKHAIIRKGLFPETLPKALRGVAFAHFDCDQFQATMDCIIHLRPKMVPGGIMAFDDYPDLRSVVAAVHANFSVEEVLFTQNRFAYVRLH